MTKIRKPEPDKIMLRMPDGWRDRIKEIAESERRSMTAEILNWIEQGMVDSQTKKKGEATA